MMDKEVKKNWVAALRSNKYAQAKSKLRGPNGYCCLGVLCDVINPHGWKSSLGGHYSYTYESIIPMYGISQNDSGEEILSPNMMRDLGIDESDQDALVDLNDSENYSFGEIADYIEEKM